MTTKTITITIPGGLNSENLLPVISKANTFASKLTVQQGDRHANAKSMLGTLSLRLMQGDTVTLAADGADEAAALDALTAML